MLAAASQCGQVMYLFKLFLKAVSNKVKVTCLQLRLYRMGLHVCTNRMHQLEPQKVKAVSTAVLMDPLLSFPSLFRNVLVEEGHGSQGTTVPSTTSSAISSKYVSRKEGKVSRKYENAVDLEEP